MKDSSSILALISCRLHSGASAGIGTAVAAECATRGARVVLACRNEAKTLAVMENLRRAVPEADVHFMLLDLASLDSVRECARKFVLSFGQLDVLINNAGKIVELSKLKQFIEECNNIE